jgi:hypothetical protein
MAIGNLLNEMVPIASKKRKLNNMTDNAAVLINPNNSSNVSKMKQIGDAEDDDDVIVLDGDSEMNEPVKSCTTFSPKYPILF